MASPLDRAPTPPFESQNIFGPFFSRPPYLRGPFFFFFSTHFPEDRCNTFDSSPLFIPPYYEQPFLGSFFLSFDDSPMGALGIESTKLSGDLFYLCIAGTSQYFF